MPAPLNHRRRRCAWLVEKGLHWDFGAGRTVLDGLDVVVWWMGSHNGFSSLVPCTRFVLLTVISGRLCERDRQRKRDED